MPRPLRVFLCHASQDKPAVRELYTALKEEGWIDPWLDKAKILPGQDWEMVIEKAVDNSDVVIVCLSNQSVTKEGFVQREIRYAYDMALEKPEDTIFLIPLRLNDCNVPRKLRSVHWVDYFGVDKEDSYSDLLKSLKQRYEQKKYLEGNELKNKLVEIQIMREAEELAYKPTAGKDVYEKAIRITSEKEKLEPVEKFGLEKTKQEFTKKSEQEKNIEGKNNKQEIYSKSLSPSAQKESERKDSKFLILGGLFFIIVFVSLFLIVSDFSKPTFPAITLTPTIVLSTPTVTPAPIIGKDGVTLLYVAEGEFLMGSTAEEQAARDNEMPQHSVELDSFWIDETEVTNSRYAQCVALGACELPTYLGSYSRAGDYYGNSQYYNYPVIHVNWYMAKNYCMWAGRRLPTEAEWEKAARGIDARYYPWGNDWHSKKFSGSGNTDGVDNSLDISVYGVLGLASNVREWVYDWYDDTYYLNSPSFNPLGPTTGDYRVLRGGAFVYEGPVEQLAAHRESAEPDYSTYYIGFRCALDASK